MLIVPIVNINSYDELKEYLKDDLDKYVIEPSIQDCEVTYRGFKQDTTILYGLVYKNIFFNFLCIKYNNKFLDGIEEYLCHDIGNKFIKELKNPYYKTLPRKKLTEDNYNYMKNRYDCIILKDITQKYFNNNLRWNWIEIL